MSIKVLIDPRAEQDILSIYDYYENIQDSLGERFYSEFMDILHLLEFYPEMYSLRSNYKCRVGVMRTFPYLLFYFISEDKVIITAVFSSYQSPKLLKSEVKRRTFL